MKEVLNSIIDAAKERLRNPVLGAFVYSWAIINWKPIFYLLFSTSSIEVRIEFISNNYSDPKDIFWLPLVFAIIYVNIFPYVLWAFDNLSSKAIKGRKLNVLSHTISDIRNKQKIAEEESILETIKASYRDKADLNTKIEILTNQLNEKEELIKLQNAELDQIRNEESRLKELINSNDTYSNNEIEKLKEEYSDFRNSDMFDFFKEIGPEISRRNSLPHGINDLVIEKYRHNGIIKEVKDDENQRILYQFTTKGEYFWRQYLKNIKIVKNDKNKDDLPF